MVFDIERVNVVVLAGGVNRIKLYDGYRPGYKGLIRLKGKPAIQYVLDAIANLPQAQRI